MAIYLANVNGDWWEFRKEHPIYVLDTDKLSPETVAHIEDYTGLDLADVVEQHGFDQIITEFGDKIQLEIGE